MKWESTIGGGFGVDRVVVSILSIYLVPDWLTGHEVFGSEKR